MPISDYWQDRGFPWEHDPGPPKNRSWARIFSETPNYRGLGKAVIGGSGEKFRWHHGPIFYRGRLSDNSVKVLVIGQEGGQDEALSHRSFTGGTGARMQHFLRYIGITRSYLFVNTFVYPIHGQYTEPGLKWLAQDPQSPIALHRHELFNYILERNSLRLVIAVGAAAKESVVSWVAAHGGSCPGGSQDVSQCDGSVLDPKTRLVGVVHPGAGGKGGSIGAIKADFIRALDKIKDWIDADPTWLPPDPDGQRQFHLPFRYRSAPIPFRDFPYGVALRLGSGSTTSNRRDGQRSIQMFSDDGRYNNSGVSLSYSDLANGDPQGYSADQGELPYEPPQAAYLEYDSGPSLAIARLMMGGKTGYEWPDFNALGAQAHPSFGSGPIYRGRLEDAFVLILADQQSHDDLFTGRALTGDAGQHIQAFLEAIGVRRSYAILRVLPVDTLDLPASAVSAMVNHPQICKIYEAIAKEIRKDSPDLGLVLTFGLNAQILAQGMDLGGLPRVSLKAWKDNGALADWQSRLADIQTINFSKDAPNPAFTYDGRRGQIPRIDLPFGVLRWQGTSGDRARQARVAGQPSPDYYKLIQPRWVFEAKPEPLTPAELAAIQGAP